MSDFFHIWNDHTSFLPSTGDEAVGISSAWAGHQTGLLLNCSWVLISLPPLVTKWDLPIVKFCWYVLCLIQNSLFKEDCDEQPDFCSHTMLLEPNKMDDVLSLSIKQNNSSWDLCQTVSCTVHIQHEAVCTWLQQHHPIKACTLVAQLSIQHFCSAQDEFPYPPFAEKDWNYFHGSNLSLRWSSRISAFCDFLILIWILWHFSSLLARKQEDKPRPTINTHTRASKANAKLKAQVK